MFLIRYAVFYIVFEPLVVLIAQGQVSLLQESCNLLAIGGI